MTSGSIDNQFTRDRLSIDLNFSAGGVFKKGYIGYFGLVQNFCAQFFGMVREHHIKTSSVNMIGIGAREAFLRAIDGMIYGDDPKQGIIKGNDFIHPDLRLSFTAPQGFYMLNSARAVSVNPKGDSGQAGQAQLTTAAYSGNLETYIRQQFQAIGGQERSLAPQELQRTRVNGLSAAYGTARVNNGNSQVDLVVFAYEFARNQAFHFVVIAPAGRAGTFNAMFQSMRRISASEASAVVPLRIDVVTVQRGDTISSLARRMAFSDNQELRFRVLNGLGNSNNLRAGDKVKLVVRGR